VKTPLLTLLAASFSLFLIMGLARAQDPSLSTAGAAYAPLEVGKKDSDPNVQLSHSQRDELMSEFKGLVHMGMRKESYESWQGKDMADCDRPERSDDRWSHRCLIITGQGDGYYYFYPNEARQSSTLQEVDIRVHADDERLLDDFRRPVQELFGRASLVDKPSVRAKPTGPIRHWDTGSDIVELFIDRSVRPEGSVRFIWMRSPLVSSARASLPVPDTETH
jgi:hypothetical protein